MEQHSKEFSRRCVRLMLKFSIVQSGVYKVFEQQCLSRIEVHQSRSSVACPKELSLSMEANGGGGAGRKRRSSCSEPMQKLVDVRRLALWLNKATLCFYYFTIVKYTLILLLRLDLLADYQFVDCFILGRFRFIGRICKISEPILMQFVFVYIIYRHVVGVTAPKQFKLGAHEFLLDDYGDVLKKTTTKCRQKRACSLLNNNYNNRPGVANTCSCHTRLMDTNYYLKCPFRVLEDQKWRPGCTWILRPNRTAESWLQLSRFTMLLFWFAVGSVCTWVLLMYSSISGLVVTMMGVELAYGPACLDWIRRRQLAAWARNESASTAAVTAMGVGDRLLDWLSSATTTTTSGNKLAYEIAIDQLPAILPWKNFIQFNWYGTLRLVADVLENNYWYMEFILYANALFCLAAISSLDCVINARELRRRLERLIAEIKCKLNNKYHDDHDDQQWPPALDEAGGSGSKPYETAKNCARALRLPFYSALVDLAQTDDQIIQLQATLVDHFALMRDYNAYLSFLIGCLSTIWCTWASVLCFAMLYINSRKLEIEFIISNACSIIIMLMFIGLMSSARSCTRQLYPLIASAMALERDKLTKKRWISIIKQYYPKAQYSFSILNTFEISWLFVLKVSVGCGLEAGGHDGHCKTIHTQSNLNELCPPARVTPRWTRGSSAPSWCTQTTSISRGARDATRTVQLVRGRCRRSKLTAARPSITVPS
jgi:hypothetical protein